jgi:hypothetical protein
MMKTPRNFICASLIVMAFLLNGCTAVNQIPTTILPLEKKGTSGPTAEEPTPTLTITPTPTIEASETPGVYPRPAEPTPTYGSSLYEAYKVRSLQELLDLVNQALEPLAGEQLYLNGKDWLLSRVKLTYTGEIQDIPPERLAFIQAWFEAEQSNLLAEQQNGLFRKEVRFTDGERELWLPVQRNVLPRLLEKVKPEEQVTVFIWWIGAWRSNSEWQLLFLVENIPIQEE